MASAILRLRIPAKLKEQMDKTHIDWNEYLCQCIREKIEQETKRHANTK
jgi:hypothetical protein